MVFFLLQIWVSFNIFTNIDIRMTPLSTSWLGTTSVDGGSVWDWEGDLELAIPNKGVENRRSLTKKNRIGYKFKKHVWIGKRRLENHNAIQFSYGVCTNQENVDVMTTVICMQG
jgi:hypothetical protein